MTNQLNTSGKSLAGADVAGGGAGVNAPSPVAGDMASPDFDEDEVHYAPFVKWAVVIFIIAVLIGAIGLLVFRGLKCGGM